MKASELRPGDFFEWQKKERYLLIGSIPKSDRLKCVWRSPQGGYFCDTIGRDTEVTPLNVTGWDDAATGETCWRDRLEASLNTIPTLSFAPIAEAPPQVATTHPAPPVITPDLIAEHGGKTGCFDIATGRFLGVEPLEYSTTRIPTPEPVQHFELGDDDLTPGVNCKKCGSQDTRPVRKPSKKAGDVHSGQVDSLANLSPPITREEKIKALAVEALKLWRESRDSGWEKYAHTEELLDAVNIMSHAYDIEHDQLTAAQARVAKLERELADEKNYSEQIETECEKKAALKIAAIKEQLSDITQKAAGLAIKLCSEEDWYSCSCGGCKRRFTSPNKRCVICDDCRLKDLTAENARLRELLRECSYELMPDAQELQDKIEGALKQ